MLRNSPSLILLVTLWLSSAQAMSQVVSSTGQPIVMVHYMPWFEAKPTSSTWGWHWTMNHFNTDQQTNGRREIASHYYPLIGPYDSSDPVVLEYQLLTMKLAGIDGVIVDWYGLTSYRDYALLHRNTTRLLEAAERLGMQFAICYEDQTIPALVEGKQIEATDRVAHAAAEIAWLGKYWFQSPSYLKLDAKPVLLSFGQTGLSETEWDACLKQAKVPVCYFSQQHRRTSAVGAFDWPTPGNSKALEQFRVDSRQWQAAIPVAYPRFVDIYAEAKVGPSYGRIDDDRGRLFRSLMESAIDSKSRIVQIATWNDWGEGTMIEPSSEFGYRDLETIQSIRRRSPQPAKTLGTAGDLRLPHKLLERRRMKTGTVQIEHLDEIAKMIVSGRIEEARRALK